MSLSQSIYVSRSGHKNITILKFTNYMLHLSRDHSVFVPSKWEMVYIVMPFLIDWAYMQIDLCLVQAGVCCEYLGKIYSCNDEI